MEDLEFDTFDPVAGRVSIDCEKRDLALTAERSVLAIMPKRVPRAPNRASVGRNGSAFLVATDHHVFGVDLFSSDLG